MSALVLAPVISANTRDHQVDREPCKGGPYTFFSGIGGELSYMDMGQDHPSELSSDNYPSFEAFYRSLMESGTRPVTVGGDHGIATPVSEAFLKMRSDEMDAVIVRLDRDLDCNAAGVHAGNGNLYEERCRHDDYDEAGMGYLLTMFPHATYIHIGSPVPFDYDEFRLKPTMKDAVARSMRTIAHYRDAHFVTGDDDIEKVLGGLDEKIRGKDIYLSVDLDCYGGVNAHEFGFTPLQGWMEMPDVACVFDWLRQGDVWGMDLCEISDLPRHTAARYAVDTYRLAMETFLR